MQQRLYSAGVSLLALILLSASTDLLSGASAGNFQEVMDTIEAKSAELSQHELFRFLADDSVPARKRMQFIPYWTYFSMAGSDLLDNWFRIPNPTTELEHRVNVFIDEDNFHYNLFLYDVENVGYTVDDFGSYTAVLRHIWGDDSKAVRMLVHTWGSGAKKNNDPLLALASFEAVEAGLKYLFEGVYENIHKGKGGFPELQYFGQKHIDYEMNHTVTGWFKDGDMDFRPLGSYEATEETKRLSLEVVDDLFYWYVRDIFVGVRMRMFTPGGHGKGSLSFMLLLVS